LRTAFCCGHDEQGDLVATGSGDRPGSRAVLDLEAVADDSDLRSVRSAYRLRNRQDGKVPGRPH
jgi:hypothetical protein